MSRIDTARRCRKLAETLRTERVASFPGIISVLEEAAATADEVAGLEQRIEELEEALVVRIKYNVCPDCDALIADGFDHTENCRHYATEGVVGD